MRTVVGIDLGTQSTKVIFYDPDARSVVARASYPHQMIAKDDGTREQEAHWWIHALSRCLESIDSKIKESAIALGVSGQQHGFVPLDSDGNVLAPVKLWCDTSTESETQEIIETLGGPEAVEKLIKTPMRVAYTATKVLWFKKHAPHLYKRLSKILLPHDYLNYYLTNLQHSEYGDASGTGLLNVFTRQWASEVLSAIDPQKDLLSCLPALLKKPYDPVGYIGKRGRALGFNPQTLVAPGGGDNMMAAIGTGATYPGCITVSLGSSGTLYGYSEVPLVDPKGDLATFCSSTGGWLPLLCTMNCTLASELTRDLFECSLPRFDQVAGEAPVGSEGVLLLPFFNGERVPNLPYAQGSFLGLTPKNMTKANLFRATMESAIFGLKRGLEAFERVGYPVKELRLTGGGAQSPLWRQITADILDRPLSVVAESEAAAFGASLQALWVFNWARGEGEKDLNTLIKKHVTVTEEVLCLPNNARDYQRCYDRYAYCISEMTNLFSQRDRRYRRDK